MRVLIVDDDEDLASAVCDALEEEGYSVARARNGQEALEQLRADGGACLILLDLMMPVMNGWEFRSAQLRDAALATIPVVLFTADPAPAQKTRELAADGYLSKQVRPGELLGTVQRFCSAA